MQARITDEGAAAPDCGRCLDRERCTKAGHCVDQGEGDTDPRPFGCICDGVVLAYCSSCRPDLFP
jgi:hypothetical protein